MASFGNNFSVGNGNQFAGGSNPFAGGGGGGNAFAGAGNPFAGGGGNPFAGGGEANTFNGSWDFGTNNPSVSQDHGFMGGNSKHEAVPESTSSIAIAIAGMTFLLYSRFKKVKHS
jgi:hypothetical protein